MTDDEELENSFPSYEDGQAPQSWVYHSLDSTEKLTTPPLWAFLFCLLYYQVW
jgi:hypothetical protein